MKKICVIYTGGTIGSAVTEGYVSLAEKCAGLLTNEYIRNHGAGNCDVVFEEATPFSMLSENICPENISLLKSAVTVALLGDCDGIIITHGTDTQCFSANLLSQVFCNASKPIVFVSALLPLSDSSTDGFINFDGAVTFIKEGIPGVFVSSADEESVCRIHLASRVCEPVQMSGFLHSIKNLYFGSVIENKFVHHDIAGNPSTDDVINNVAGCNLDEADTDILVIHSRGLLNYGMYDLNRTKPHAVIIELYHSGTACTVGDIFSAVEFITKCNEKNIPVVLSPIDSMANVYSSTDTLYGKCILAEDMCYEMTTVKVMLALGSGMDIDEVLKTNNFFEKVIND